MVSIAYLTTFSCLSYIVSFSCQASQLMQNRIDFKWAFKLGSLISVLCHGYLLYKLIETPMGQNLDRWIVLSLILWVLNISLLLFTHLSKIENLSLFAYPITILVLILSASLSTPDIIQTKAFNGMISHILISLFATSVLSLACLQSLLLGLQNYQLKHPTPSRLLSLLPPLQSMESLLFGFIWLGVLFLSLALMSGFWFQYHYPDLGHQSKIILSLLAWLVLVGLLIGRYRLGWRAQTAVIGTSIGFVLIFTAYFGTNL